MILIHSVTETQAVRCAPTETEQRTPARKNDSNFLPLLYEYGKPYLREIEF